MLADRQQFKELLKAFESNQVFAHMHPYELFRKWLEAVWAFLNAPYEPEHFKTTLDAYTAEQGAEFSRLLMIYVNAVEALP